MDAHKYEGLPHRNQIMTISLRVRSIMKRPVISVDISETAKGAAERMVEHEIGSIVVTKGNEPVGIVTERDILKKVTCKGRSPDEVRVSEVMSSPLITIDADATIGDATLRMQLKKVRRLLVTEEGRIVGIVSQRDLQEGTLNVFLALANL